MQVVNFAIWDDTGMAASPAFRAAAAAKGVPHVSTEQALQAVHDATTLTAPQLLVMDAAQHRDLVDATDETVPATPAPVIMPMPTAAVPTAVPVPVQTRAAGSSVRDVIADLIAAELGQRAADIDDNASFLAMGLDSLTAVDLVKRLEHELVRPLPTTLLFEYSSIAQLTAYLSKAPSQEQSAQEQSAQEQSCAGIRRA